jgi:hypothetical protein
MTRLYVLLLSVLAGIVVGYIDMYASEVQATLMIMLPSAFALGYAYPRGAWHTALIIGLSVPAAHYLGEAMNYVPYPVTPRYSTFYALLPAFFGTYFGVLSNLLIRRNSDASSH